MASGEGTSCGLSQDKKDGERVAICKENSESDDEPSVDSEEWMPYKDREDWKDVQPIPLYEGPQPVVQINYSERFREVYSYFRVIVKNNEVSERALHLTRDAANLNPANYTVWSFRRKLLSALSKDLYNELDYVGDVITAHPKNYQIWHHRQCVVGTLMDASKEKAFTEFAFVDDSKNYHCWQYRQWVVREFSLWDGELEFTEKMIAEDVRNNSAWNHRYFIINGTTEFTESVIIREFEFVTELIRKAPDNESSWNYLRGLYLGKNMYESGSLQEFSQQLWDAGCRSYHLLALVVDLCAEEVDHLPQASPRTSQLKERALEVCQLLSEKHDRIRGNYWKYIYRQLEQK